MISQYCQISSEIKPVSRPNWARRSNPSRAAEADRHLLAVHDHRHRAPSAAEGQHPREGRSVFFHVEVFERNLPPLKVVTGGLCVRSSVLAEDVDHVAILTPCSSNPVISLSSSHVNRRSIRSPFRRHCQFIRVSFALHSQVIRASSARHPVDIPFSSAGHRADVGPARYPIRPLGSEDENAATSRSAAFAKSASASGSQREMPRDPE